MTHRDDIISHLAVLPPRDFVENVRASLGFDRQWEVLTDERIIARTEWALDRMIVSLDRQAEKIGDTDPDWTRRAGALRRLIVRRQAEIAPPEPVILSNTREARDWRAFAARLARELGECDPEALQRVRAPYGALSAAEWLAAREAKNRKEAAR